MLTSATAPLNCKCCIFATSYWSIRLAPIQVSVCVEVALFQRRDLLRAFPARTDCEFMASRSGDAGVEVSTGRFGFCTLLATAERPTEVECFVAASEREWSIILVPVTAAKVAVSESDWREQLRRPRAVRPVVLSSRSRALPVVSR